MHILPIWYDITLLLNSVIITALHRQYFVLILCTDLKMSSRTRFELKAIMSCVSPSPARGPLPVSLSGALGLAWPRTLRFGPPSVAFLTTRLKPSPLWWLSHAGGHTHPLGSSSRERRPGLVPQAPPGAAFLGRARWRPGCSVSHSFLPHSQKHPSCCCPHLVSLGKRTLWS